MKKICPKCKRGMKRSDKGVTTTCGRCRLGYRPETPPIPKKKSGRSNADKRLSEFVSDRLKQMIERHERGEDLWA